GELRDLEADLVITVRVRVGHDLQLSGRRCHRLTVTQGRAVGQLAREPGGPGQRDVGGFTGAPRARASERARQMVSRRLSAIVAGTCSRINTSAPRLSAAKPRAPSRQLTRAPVCPASLVRTTPGWRLSNTLV